MTDKPVQIDYGIKEINELNISFPNTNVLIDSPLELGVKFVFDFDVELNEISIIMEFRYLKMPDSIEIFSMKVESVFHCGNLVQFKKTDDSNDFDLPPDFASLLLGISISHSRALISKELKGSSLDRFILPIMNPKEMLEKSIDVDHF